MDKLLPSNIDSLIPRQLQRAFVAGLVILLLIKIIAAGIVFLQLGSIPGEIRSIASNTADASLIAQADSLIQKVWFTITLLIF